MSKEGQNIKVVVRLRPLNALEMDQGGESCVVFNDKSITVMVFQMSLLIIASQEMRKMISLLTVSSAQIVPRRTSTRK